MQPIEILETARKMVADGNIKGGQDFLVEHFQELPEDIQGDLLIEFIKDAGSDNQFQNLATDIKEEAVNVIEMIDNAQKALEKGNTGG